MEREEIEYRSYQLVIAKHHVLWQVHVYPREVAAVRLPPGEDFAEDSHKQTAIEKAKGLIDKHQSQPRPKVIDEPPRIG